MEQTQAMNEARPGDEPRRCPDCGQELPPGRLAGNCPHCLLRLVAAQPAEAPPVPPAQRRPTPPSAGAIGQLGDYELLAEVARGGMGVVFRARQLSLNRLVAVKLLHCGLFASDTARQRFRREAQAAARLQHPHIVSIYEVGEDEGQPYFSMELIEGRNLAELTREQVRPPRQAAAWLRCIAETVHYAHQRGVLHRDLKPSNVLLDAAGQPHVTDFGLARLEGESDLTLSGEVLGTPGFLSPEQVAGQRAAVGVASDVYALGALLYHLVTGRPPFLVDSVEGTLRQVVEQDPVSPRLLNPALPRDLETICLKCLSKEPARRYASAQALADDLDRWLRGEPIQARPTPVAEKLWLWAKRHPAIAGLGGAVFVLLFIVAVGSTLAALRIQRAHQEAHQAEQAALREKTSALEALWQALRAQARANRFRSEPGQRLETLDAIRRAAAIRPSMQLRSEAIAALGVPDVSRLREAPFPTDADEMNVCVDTDLTRYACRVQATNISVRRVADDAELARLTTDGPPVTRVDRFSPDGRYLLGATARGFCLFDVPRARLLLTRLGHADFSPDGRELAHQNRRGQIEFYDLAQLAVTHTLDSAYQSVTPCYSPDGTRLACRQRDQIDLWDARQGTLLRTLTATEAFDGFAWSADGHLLAAGDGDNARVFDAETGQEQLVLRGHAARVVRVAFSQVGEFLATSSWDQTTRLWSLRTGRLLLKMPGVSYGLHFSPDDQRLGLIGKQVWRFHTPRACRDVHLPDEHFHGRHFDFSPNGRLLVVGRGQGDSYAFYEVATQRELGRLPAMRPPNYAGKTFEVAFAPDGQSVFTATPYGLHRWHLKIESNAVTVLRRDELDAGPYDAGLAVHGDTVIAAQYHQGYARLWRSPDTNAQSVRLGHTNCQDVSLTRDGRYAATGAWNGDGVKVWSGAGELLACLGHQESAQPFFSPDNQWLLIAQKDYRLWKVGTWEPGPTFTPNHQHASKGDACFSPDGTLLVLRLDNSTLALVKLPQAETLALLQTPTGLALHRSRFTPDGRQLWAHIHGGGFYVWDLPLIHEELRAVGLDCD